MKNKKMIVILVAVIILILAVVWGKGFLSVDSCLDSGGRWNSESKNCEH